MEARRSIRVASRLWLAVEGVDTELLAREGDISVSGVYFRTDRAIGRVGSVQRLHIAIRLGPAQCSVLARVVRLVTSEDLRLGRYVVGVGLEFLHDTSNGRTALTRLVREVLDDKAFDDAAVSVASDFPARCFPAEDQQAMPATVKRLGGRRMSLDTQWPVAPGAPVRVEIDLKSSREPVRFDAEAIDVIESTDGSSDRFRIELRIHDDEQRDVGDANPSGLSALFADLIAEPDTSSPPTRKEHLTGLLSRIHLTSLLQLVELERMTGRLDVSYQGVDGLLLLSEGRLIDVRLDGKDSPRAALATLLGWADGEFEFHLQPVPDPDRFGIPTSALLLDIFREFDEARQKH